VEEEIREESEAGEEREREKKRMVNRKFCVLN
jgi:hypothetical protein